MLVKFPNRTLGIFALAALAACGSSSAQTPTSPVPLLAIYSMEPDAADARRMTDSGPFGVHGKLADGVTLDAGGRRGYALRFSGEGEGVAKVNERKLLDRIGAPFSFALWLKAEAPAANGTIAAIITKREGWWAPTPFTLSLGGTDGALILDAYNGKDGGAGGRVLNAYKVGEWVHVAVTFAADGDRVIYLNGKPVSQGRMEGSLAPNDQPLVFGYEKGGDFPGGGRSKFKGLIDEVHLYAAALTQDQVTADMNGTPFSTRPAVDRDFAAPSHFVHLWLTRWDLPLGFAPRISRTRQPVKRVAGPDAVDWPAMRLQGAKVFENSAEEAHFYPLRREPENRPLLRQPFDETCTLEPGGHWFRAVQWLWGRRYIYTSDRSTRGAERDFEIWTFPIKIETAGPGADLRNIVLRCNGETLYQNAGPLHSLTLQLPQNTPDQPYELSVNGRAPVTFDAGLLPVKLGDPADEAIPVDLTFPGEPKITVRGLDRPGDFPNPKEWQEDLKAVAALRAGPAAGPSVPRPFAFQRQVKTMTDYLGVEVPRSPLAIHTVNMTHGMSGGHYYGSEHGPGAFNGGGGFPGSVEDYAAYLADLGYDRVFERVNGGIPAPEDAGSYEKWLAALALRGVQGGLNIVALNDANLAFYSYALPEYNRPRERDAQLIVQRFGQFPNLAGASMGADNAGYAPYWDWSPATPERPWAEAFTQFQQGRPLRAPVPPGMSADKDYEYPASSMRDFTDYIARYDESFKRYGHFASAVREVDPKLAFTTQSFGSSPGVGAHGGYRWSSIPGLPMHEGVPVLQSYDWDETTAAKPLHNVALIDRLISYYPDKPAWALLDDFMLKYGREARQRAFALALTRGIQSVGPNWLAHTAGKFARPQIAGDERELYAWCHKYGGAYAMTKPLPSVGVLYVHQQAVARRSDAKEPRSPHEGKTTEALFLAHAAGWPAKIITPEELRHGLPASMGAVLLVGLNRIDESWHWYDGSTEALAAFVKRGGRLLLDDESSGPPGVQTVKTEMSVRAYVAQGDGTTDIAATDDKTPVLIARNAANIDRLRNVLRDLPAPFAVSDEPTIWAVPTVAGDVQYLTAVNQGSEPGKNATQYIRPQTGRLTWKTDRPIYDVRARRRLTAAQAATVDLTKDGFQWYALPPAEITAPTARVEPGSDGFYTATAEFGARKMSGVPVQFTVTRGDESAVVYAASGVSAKLPVTTAEAGDYTVKVTELLTGQESSAPLRVAPASAPGLSRDDAQLADRLARFAARRDVPLTLALTSEQTGDPAYKALAAELAAVLAPLRTVAIREIAPGDVVRSLEPVVAAQPFPRWRTIDSDLILLGSPADNPLLLDEARGYLLPAAMFNAENAAAGITPPLSVAYSPFAGGFQALNLAGSTPAVLGAHLARLRATVAAAAPATQSGSH